MTEWLIIGGMVVVTFTPRTLPLLLANRLRLPPRLHQALGYVPVAVLTVIIVQTSFYPAGELQLHWRNPYLWGLVVALISARCQPRLLLTVLLGMCSYALAKWLM